MLDVAVIGVPHARWGETPCTFIVPSDVADPPTESAVVEHCIRLARYKRPTSVEIVDELPRNTLGKVQKRELRQRIT